MQHATLFFLLSFVFFSFALVHDPSHIPRNVTELRTITPRDDDTVCGTAMMNFNWGASDVAKPRSATLYFYYDNTFLDTTYNYEGEWVAFGEAGDNILVFDYPAAKYVSPRNNGEGSMISHGTCGTWSFEGFKWYCPNACA